MKRRGNDYRLHAERLHLALHPPAVGAGLEHDGPVARFPERYALSPSLVVGIVVSSRIRLVPRSLAMTQTFVVRSLTSMPIVV